MRPCQNACSPWVEPEDLPCEEGVAPELLEEAVAVATDILFEMSGRKYAGSCRDTVRLLRQTCGCSDRCSCHSDGLHRVTLGGYPVTSIIEVKVGGEVWDPSRYRVDDFRYLVRLPDQDGSKLSWPFSDEVDVTFTYGVGPASDGVRAAKTLACEFVKAWTNDSSCKLPSRVSSVSRQGVSMVVLDPFEFFERNRTGLWQVDAFLAASNPNGTRRRAAVISPDIGPSVRRVGT